MDYGLLAPELLLAGLAFVVFAIDLFLPESRKPVLAWISVLGMALIGVFCASWWGRTGSVAGGMYLLDDYALLFKLLALAMGIAVTIASIDYARRALPQAGEFYALLVFATLGFFVMAAAGELITAYIGLELVNFCLYALVSYSKWNPRSNEAGVKYILLGAISSAILLYGLSLLYGITGTTYYAGIAQALNGAEMTPGLLVALVFVVGGLGFKIAAVPFHMWAPDAYEGAPTPITAYLAVASKAAGFALLLRLFAEALRPMRLEMQPALAVVAAATMILGNVVAILQTNIKRMLAYSSIGHVGYLVLGLTVLWQGAAEAIMLYIAGYAATSLAAFLAVILVQNATGSEDIADYAGMAERSPMIAFSLTVALFSLAGLPLFAGFVIKFYLFLAVAQAGLLWLVALAILTSVISLYYYLMVIKQMYVRAEEDQERLAIGLPERTLLGILVVFVVAIGVYPGPLFDFVRMAARALFSS